MSRNNSRTAALALAVLLVPGVASGEVYPCPSDPGFCYRDFGDDGCFDSGVDDGPINTEIENSSSFPPVPPAGTIVCPPSVKELSGGGSSGFQLSTASGSSILFYAARVVDVTGLNIMSGGRVLLGEKVYGTLSSDIDAEGDIVIERGMTLGGGGNSYLRAETSAGDIIVGSKAVIKTRNAARFRAPAGNISFLDGASVIAQKGVTADVEIAAGGAVDMVGTKIRAKPEGSFSGSSEVVIEGATVDLREMIKIKMSAEAGALSGVAIQATAGDVTIDRLSVNANRPVTISGENVVIGVSSSPKVPTSVITQKGVQEIEILATDSIQIENLRVTTKDDVLFETSGTTVNLLGSTLKGKGATPTFEVSAGAGSTCDLTGTSVKNGTLVTNCNTVIGP